MHTEKISLDHTRCDETWRMERLEHFLLTIQKETSHIVNLNDFWIDRIYDHKGELTIYWNVKPPEIINDIIKKVWQYKFNENNILNEYHIR